MMPMTYCCLLCAKGEQGRRGQEEVSLFEDGQARAGPRYVVLSRVTHNQSIGTDERFQVDSKSCCVISSPSWGSILALQWPSSQSFVFIFSKQSRKARARCHPTQSAIWRSTSLDGCGSHGPFLTVRPSITLAVCALTYEKWKASQLY